MAQAAAASRTVVEVRRRCEIVQRLEAARALVETAPLREVAIELVTQGLDLVDRTERRGVFVDAVMQLDVENYDVAP